MQILSPRQKLAVRASEVREKPSKGDQRGGRKTKSFEGGVLSATVLAFGALGDLGALGLLVFWGFEGLRVLGGFRGSRDYASGFGRELNSSAGWVALAWTYFRSKP